MFFMTIKHADIVSVDRYCGINTSVSASHFLRHCSPALTERELQTLELISKGFNNKNIAKAFDVSESTVKSHVKNLLRKFNARSRLELAVLSYRTTGGGGAMGGADISSFGSQSDDGWISISNAKFVINRSGYIVRHNKDWQLLMGGDTCGSMVVDNVHHRDKKAWETFLNAIVQFVPNSHISDVRFISNLGDELTLTLNSFIFHDEFYFVVEKVSTVVDYKDRFNFGFANASNLIESLPGLFYKSRKASTWVMEYVSSGSVKLLGYTPEELVERRDSTWEELIIPEDKFIVWSTVEEAVSGHTPFRIKYKIRCADGVVKSISEWGVGIYGPEGQPIGIEGAIFEDNRVT